VSGYQILQGNPAESTAWMPSGKRRSRRPRVFLRSKRARGGGPGGEEGGAAGAQRWFRRALRWRAGCEATISTLKHPFSMRRATYKGEPGFQRYVGWCVITKNWSPEFNTLLGWQVIVRRFRTESLG
jgi:hypothetical protein